MAPSSAAPSRQRLWARRSALGALVLATSLAVAFYASVWLVPPYLALMAWLLRPPADRRARAAVAEVSETGEALGTAVVDEGLVESSAVSWDDATPSEASPDPSAAAEADPATATAALKTKRGRPRGRKAKPAPAVEPATQVTWIRVGPGKFVRVEGGNPQAADDAPSAEAGRDPADVAPAFPSSPVDAPPGDAEAAPAAEVDPDAGAPAEEPEAGAAEAELDADSAADPPPALEEAPPPDAPGADGVTEDPPVDALDGDRHQPPGRTNEASEPPEAADVAEASYMDDSEPPSTAVEEFEDVGPEPDPEVAVDLVDELSEGADPDPGDPTPDVGPADFESDTCEDPEDAPSPTPVDPSIPDGPSTRSAGHALWGALRAVCPHLTRPFRPAADRSPSRRAPRAGRWARVVPVLRRRPRRQFGRRAWRALHARSPPAGGLLPHRGSLANPAGIGVTPAPAGFASFLYVK